MTDDRPLPIRRLAAAVLAALLVSLASAAPALGQHLRIYYPDIEQGSATLVASPTGKGLLVDAGSELPTVPSPRTGTPTPSTPAAWGTPRWGSRSSG